jgi:uncharacterized protein
LSCCNNIEISNSLSWTKFAFVVVLSWGWFAIRSVAVVFGMMDLPPFDNSKFFQLVCYELCAGGVVYHFLRKNGWVLNRDALDVNWSTTAAGGLLLMVATLLYGVTYGIGLSLGGSAQPLHDISASITISRPLAAIASMVNGTYEELFLVGFVFRALKRESLSFIVGMSVLLRVLAHVYQGPVGALGILTMGVLFAMVYARYRQMWTLIVAHVACDMLALIR